MIIVHTNILATAVMLSYGLMPVLFGQPQSVMALEQPSRVKAPFQKGEQLEIQADATVPAGITRVVVLDTTHWPWVLVKLEEGEMWLNFDHVVTAKAVATAK